MRKIPLVVGFLLVSLLLSSSITSSPRSVQPIFADDAAKNSTGLTIQEQQQSAESETQTNDDASKNTNDNEVSREEIVQPKANRSPKADAGPDVVVNEGEKVVLNGEKSTDPDGDKVSFAWAQIPSKKPALILKDSDSNKASFVAPEIDSKPITVSFKVTVIDSKGLQDNDVVRIKVMNVALPTSNHNKRTNPNQESFQNIRNHTSGNNAKSSKTESEVKESPASMVKTGTVKTFAFDVPSPPSTGDGGVSIVRHDVRDFYEPQTCPIQPAPTGCPAHIEWNTIVTGSLTRGADHGSYIDYVQNDDFKWTCYFNGFLVHTDSHTPHPALLYFYKSGSLQVAILTPTPNSHGDGCLNLGTAQTSSECPVTKIIVCPYFLPGTTQSDGTVTGTGNTPLETIATTDSDGHPDISTTSASYSYILNDVQSPELLANAKIVFPAAYPNGIVYANPGQVITLDGSKSHPSTAGGSIQHYEWLKVEGPAAAPMTLQGVKPTFDFPVIDPIPPIDLKVSYSLKVTDNDGKESTNTAVATVHLNHPPEPTINVTPPSPVKPLEKVTLDASQSKDIDAGDQLSYRWSIEPTSIQLSNTEGPTSGFTAPKEETGIVVHLSVTDLSLAITSTFKSVEVKCSTSSTPTCSKPTVTVSVANSEINPYPVNVNPSKPQTKITVTSTNTDGSPAKSVQVEVKACTQLGSSAIDGHTHDKDTGDPCFHSTRPKSTLQNDVQNGNPIVVTTGDTGTAEATYSPPTSTGSDGKSYYISGLDTIIASLKTDPDTKDDSKTITTKVPGLERMSLSTTCPGGDETYFFEAQSNHQCLFFGTQSANVGLVQLGKDFRQRQLDCAQAKSPRLEPACNVTPTGSKAIDFVKITGSPIPLKITAMALPWGGLLDVSGNWKPPYFTHNDGNNVDVGFNIKGKSMTVEQKKLLRDVIIDSGNKLPYSEEGKEEDVTKAKDHYHIEFIDCSANSFTISSTPKLKTDAPVACKQTIQGTVKVELDKRGIFPLKEIKMELCPEGQACFLVYTDDKGEYKAGISTPNIKSVKIRIFLEDKQKSFKVVYKAPGIDSAHIAIIKLTESGDQADILLSSKSPNIFLNGKPTGVTKGDANVPLNDFPDLAALYYYSKIGMEFANRYMPGKIAFNLPLEVVGFGIKDPISGSYDAFIHFNGHGIKPYIFVDLGYSFLANEFQTEERLDPFFHEFGHFIDYETGGGLPKNNNRELHPDLENFLEANHIKVDLDCHNGYAQIDSSCALFEGRATFISAAISDTMLTDSGHARFQNSAFMYLVGGQRINLDLGFDNPVGKRILSRSNSPVSPPSEPFFELVSNQEESNAASLLWNLNQNNRLDLRIILEAALSSATLTDLYKLLSSSVPEDSLKVIYASYGLCDDMTGVKFKLSPDGNCNPSEVDSGFTTWMAQVKYPGGKTIQFKYENGRP